MKLKQTLLTIALILSTQASNAMIAPWYVQLRVFDAVVSAFAHENKVAPDETDDLEIATLQFIDNATYAISNEDLSCTFTVTTKPLPPGALGVPGYVATKDSCGPNEAKNVKTVSYDDLSEKLNQAAKFQKQVIKATVTKKGTVKLTYKK